MVTLVLLTLAGFADEKKDAPPKADVRGEVTAVALVKGRGVVGTLVIKGKKEADTGYDQASLRATIATKVWRWKDGKKEPALFRDVKKGDRVQAVFAGPVAESSAIQATAGEVLILETPKK